MHLGPIGSNQYSRTQNSLGAEAYTGHCLESLQRVANDSINKFISWLGSVMILLALCIVVNCRAPQPKAPTRQFCVARRFKITTSVSSEKQ